jgi:hypothetical protein
MKIRRSARFTFALVIAVMCGFLLSNLFTVCQYANNGPRDLDDFRFSESAVSSLSARTQPSNANTSCVTNSNDPFHPNKCCDPSIPTFMETAQPYETDKVGADVGCGAGHGGHCFQRMYQDFLSPIRCRSGLRLLEIGLACGYAHGGTAFTLWADYFPSLELLVGMEYEECVETMMKATWEKGIPEQLKRITTPEHWATMYKKVRLERGDQSVPADLERVANAYGPFDIVIDDGGHSMKQQIWTLIYMFPFIKPGGLFFVEDLNSNFIPGPNWHDHPIRMIDYIAKLQEALHYRATALHLDPQLFPRFNETLDALHSIHCYPEACVLVKLPAGPAARH